MLAGRAWGVGSCGRPSAGRASRWKIGASELEICGEGGQGNDISSS